MRYVLACQVDGDLYFREPGSVQRSDIGYEFRCDADGRLTEIAASVRVPDEMLSQFESKIEPGQGDVKVKVTVGGNRDLYDRLISELQFLESDLSFASVASLEKIHWEDPNIEFVAESDEDLTLNPVTALGMRKEYAPMRVVFSIADVDAILNESSTLSQLRICKAFWRDGHTYFREFKYIQAFYAFYFVIEDFYAGGKSSQNQVVSQFSSSRSFLAVAGAAFDSLVSESRHRLSLEQLFASENLEFGKEELPKLLFRVRGRLHHFSSKSSRTQGTPFNQEDFESITLMLMHMATRTIQQNDPWAKGRTMTRIR